MEEKLYFQNSKGNKLCGILSNPTGDKTRPIIILCHGFNSSKNSSTNTALKLILSRNNISSFRFDFFAHGESEGNFEDLTQSEAVDDALQAIKFIKNLGYTKIGLFGSSFGGLAAKSHLESVDKVKETAESASRDQAVAKEKINQIREKVDEIKDDVKEIKKILQENRRTK